MPTLGRRDFLKATGATALVAAAGVAAVTVTVTANRDEVCAERIEVVVPDLDPAQDGLRVAQLSDVHVGSLTPVERVRAAVALANAFDPDLVALTGDYLSGSGSRRLRAGPAAVSEQLRGLVAPAVAVLGNHDHWVDARGAAAALTRIGCCVLRNENTTLTLRGAPFTVVGIDDHSTRHADPARALRGAAARSRLHLAHDPTTIDLLRDRGLPMLVLSGHTHGGQLNVPPLTLMLPLPYRAGLYRVGPISLYVNRGIGDTWVPLRLRAPPEVTLFTLRSTVRGEPPPRRAGS